MHYWPFSLKTRLPQHRVVCVLTVCFVVCLVGCSREDPPVTETAATPVRIEAVAPSSFVPTLDLFGEVGPNSRHPIQSPITGRVTFSQRFRDGLRAGVRVSKGEQLVEIVNEQLELEVIEARLQLKAANTELERARGGVEGGFLAEIDLRKAEVAHELAQERLASVDQRQSRLAVRSPVGGFLIIEELITPGTEVTSGSVLAWVGAEGAERIQGFAATSDLSILRLGLVVECRRPGGEVVAMARVTEIPRQVGAGGTVTVIAEVTESFAMPPAGDGLELRVLLEEVGDAIHVPKKAILRSAGVDSIYVLTASGEQYQAERRQVRLGGSSSERVLVLEGLRAGEIVAVDGIELLSDGSMARDAAIESPVKQFTALPAGQPSLSSSLVSPLDRLLRPYESSARSMT